jgi:hypothetical protein
MPAIAWSLQRRPLSSLTEWPDNPRCLTTKGMADLKRSIEKFGCCEPLVVNTDGQIIGGHGRKKVIESLGIKEVDCYFPDRTLTKEECEECGIRLNQNIAGEWNFETLANLWPVETLTEWGFDEKELGIKLPKKISKEDFDDSLVIKISIIYISAEDWLNWKNQIVNFLNDNNINHRIEE